MNPTLLILVADPENEETVVDWLLAQDAIGGFTGHRGFGHSTEHGRFSLAEQVTGRQDRVLFHVESDAATAARLLDGLRAELPGLGIRYWLIPLAGAGRIG
ncbi:MAG TPA: DUF3240 domain-containing protein [Thioalkalivibrio sp.]|nr:DUF3240 domain-containing protein [Thioalkalivibrio sp.]